MIRFKRYANRKIYCSNWETGKAKKLACYVTMADILKVLRQGHRIEVLENETGEDITDYILAKCLEDAATQGKVQREKLYEMFGKNGYEL